MTTNNKSRLLNEQTSLTIQGAELTIKCVQIAGVLARRIVCWKRRGERVKCGEQFGMIKFGRSEEHTSELQSRLHLVCRLLLEKKKKHKSLTNMLKIVALRLP